ncbi:hypothetical protein ACVIGA_005936 [Bradyrhizobium sp. USDA 3240]
MTTSPIANPCVAVPYDRGRRCVRFLRSSAAYCRFQRIVRSAASEEGRTAADAKARAKSIAKVSTSQPISAPARACSRPARSRPQSRPRNGSRSRTKTNLSAAARAAPLAAGHALYRPASNAPPRMDSYLQHDLPENRHDLFRIMHPEISRRAAPWLRRQHAFAVVFHASLQEDAVLRSEVEYPSGSRIGPA